MHLPADTPLTPAEQIARARTLRAFDRMAAIGALTALAVLAAALRAGRDVGDVWPVFLLLAVDLALPVYKRWELSARRSRSSGRRRTTHG